MGASLSATVLKSERHMPTRVCRVSECCRVSTLSSIDSQSYRVRVDSERGKVTRIWSVLMPRLCLLIRLLGFLDAVVMCWCW